MADDDVILRIQVEDDASGASSPAQDKVTQRLERLVAEAKKLGINVGRDTLYGAGGATRPEMVSSVRRAIESHTTGRDLAQERIDANRVRREEIRARQQRAINTNRPAVQYQPSGPQYGPVQESPQYGPERPTRPQPSPGRHHTVPMRPPPRLPAGSGGGRPPVVPPARVPAGGGGAGAAAARVAPAALAAGAALAALTAAAVAASRTFRMLNSEVERSRQFSPSLAAATQVGQARGVLGDVRRAGQASANLSDFVYARDAAVEELKDIRTTFLDNVAPAMTEIVKVVGSIAKGINKMAELAELANGNAADEDIIEMWNRVLDPERFDRRMKRD